MPNAPPTPKPAGKPADTVPSGPTKPADKSDQKPVEIGGPAGPEPTRYGDWERKGLAVDF
jgi:hypothetical protein